MAKRKRGRPRNPHAKRRTTTRIGRSTGVDPRDRGTDELRLKRITITGSDQLSHSDPLAALFGRNLISTAEYNAGRDIADLISIIQRAQFGSIWLRILSAPGGQLSFDPSPHVERAQYTLHRIGTIIGPASPIVFDTCGGEWKWVVHILKAKRKLDQAIARKAEITTLEPLATNFSQQIDLISTSLNTVANRWSGTRLAA